MGRYYVMQDRLGMQKTLESALKAVPWTKAKGNFIHRVMNQLAGRKCSKAEVEVAVKRTSQTSSMHNGRMTTHAPALNLSDKRVRDVVRSLLQNNTGTGFELFNFRWLSKLKRM